MKIIPAIDIMNGQCVRLTQGHYNRVKVYDSNPLDVAKSFEAAGIEYLHVVDLDGARSSKVKNYKVLEEIITKTELKVDFGGGLKSYDDVKRVFSIGASCVTIGSIAVKESNVFFNWLKEFGHDRIILGADCMDRKIVTSGWQESNDIDVLNFISDCSNKGITQVICTDVSKDGMLSGPAIDLYSEIIKKVNVDLIASGGISNISDVKKLQDVDCKGVIIGKAIYEQKISLKELSELC